MTGLARYALALAAGLAAMAAWSGLMVQKGVVKEQVRVTEVGKKVDAAAKAKRKIVEKKKPEEIRADLRRFCVDCDK
jgi:hypothetical protein